MKKVSGIRAESQMLSGKKLITFYDTDNNDFVLKYDSSGISSKVGALKDESAKKEVSQTVMVDKFIRISTVLRLEGEMVDIYAMLPKQPEEENEQN